ncbi:MAG: ribonuclease III [Bacillota bacterium]|nr:ribonuclease III [Bacillota bacterium]
MDKGGRNLRHLETILGYKFKDKNLLKLALTHRSLGQHPANNNERMEFLGDAVLQLTVSTYLYEKFPKLPEGELAKTRSLLVRESTLAELARELRLNEYLLVGKGEQRSHAQDRDSLLCDVLEAIYGAIYLDGGFELAQKVILNHLPEWDHKQVAIIDAKSTLQEHFQQTAKKPPVYELIDERGPDHDKLFVVEVSFDNEVLGRGTGPTKKEAEQEAARQALSIVGL